MDEKKYSQACENKDKTIVEKKNYTKPEISELGSMVRVTLGGSVFEGDSGGGLQT